VVFKVAVEAFEEALTPLLLVGALKHVIMVLFILTSRAKVTGGPPLLGDPEIAIAPTPVSPGRLARNIVWLDEARPSHVPLKMSLYESF
jgi:hypothetical protein